MKRIVLILIALCFAVTQAMASAGSGIKAAVDELQFTLVVEGAALNAEAKEIALKTFHARVDSMVQEGESRNALLAEAATLIKDERLAGEVKSVLAQFGDREISAERSQELLSQIAKNSSAQGASWNGDVVMYGAMAAMLALIIILTVTAEPGPCADDVYAAENVDECTYDDYVDRDYGWRDNW